MVALGRGSRGVFMVGGVLKVFQRSCWGIWCGRRLNGNCLSALRKCKTVLLCLGVIICFAVLVFPLCCE